jgi:hypothetical protein
MRKSRRRIYYQKNITEQVEKGSIFFDTISGQYLYCDDTINAHPPAVPHGSHPQDAGFTSSLQ